MDKIDRLMQLVQDSKKDAGVHIIDIKEKYCAQCNGKCKAQGADNAVFIFNDIPKGYVAKIPDILIYENAEPEQIREVEEFRTESLTKREREAVAQKKEIDLQNKETPYRRLFGYG